jgi:hypothetical protein
MPFSRTMLGGKETGGRLRVSLSRVHFGKRSDFGNRENSLNESIRYPFFVDGGLGYLFNFEAV